MSANRRDAPRRDSCRIGALGVEGGAGTSECLVWDLSETGAQIEVDADAPVPDRFTLRIAAGEPPLACRVVRREGLRLGVRFDR